MRNPVQRIHDLFRAFDEGGPPGPLYSLLEEVPLDTEDAVAAVIQGFDCKEWRGHLAAAKTLRNATKFPGLAVPALIEALKDPESLVWEEAAESLGCFGAAADAAVPALLRKLQKADEFGAENLVVALGKIATRADEVVPVLAGLIDDEQFGAAACRALGSYPDRLPTHFEALRSALGSPDWPVRAAAADALARHPNRGLIIDTFVQRILDEPEDARHLVPHLAAFGEETDRIVLTLVRVLEPFALEPLMTKFSAHRRLSDLLRDRQTTVRRRAATLARDRSVVPGLIAVLDDVAVAPAAIDALARVGDGTAADALERYRAPNEDLGDRARHALRRLGRSPSVPTGGIDARGLRKVAIPPFTGDRVVVHEGRVWFAWHRILEPGPRDEWKTDADELGIAALDPATDAVESWTLPVGFPVQPTGGAGAVRRWRLEFVIEEGLVCVLQDPFSDRRGWGNDNYVYAFRDGWRRFDGKAWSPVAWAKRQDPAHAVCGGELVAWKDAAGGFGWHADNTPYHLDDWEFTDDVRKAFAERAAFEAREPQLQVSVVSHDLWIVDREAHRERPMPAPGQRRIYGAAGVLGDDARPVAASHHVVFTNAGALVG